MTMAGLSKPSIALIPGSFFRPALYNALIDELAAQGYPSTAIALQSVDCSTPKEVNVEADRDFIRSHLTRLVEEEEKELLVVLHSYGAVPGSAALSGLSRRERQDKGLSGGIIGILYVSAILAAAGETTIQNMGSEEPSWSAYNPTTGNTDVVADIVPVLFNDIDSHLLSTAQQTVGTQAGAVYMNPAPKPAWAEAQFSGRLAYVRCTRDGCVLPHLQDNMLQKSGVRWEVIDFDGGHCPMLSQTALLVDTISQFADKMRALKN